MTSTTTLVKEYLQDDWDFLTEDLDADEPHTLRHEGRRWVQTSAERFAPWDEVTGVNVPMVRVTYRPE